MLRSLHFRQDVGLGLGSDGSDVGKGSAPSLSLREAEDHRPPPAEAEAPSNCGGARGGSGFGGCVSGGGAAEENNKAPSPPVQQEL